MSVISYSRPHDNYFVDGYRFTTMMGECRLYFARDIETPQDREKALAYAAPFKDECSSYPWIYISGYSLLPTGATGVTEATGCGTPASS